jgi:hypothetical protein
VLLCVASQRNPIYCAVYVHAAATATTGCVGRESSWKKQGDSPATTTAITQCAAMPVRGSAMHALHVHNTHLPSANHIMYHCYW